MVRLWCVPFAGGTVYSYRKLTNFLAPSVAFAPLELPGRGKRIGEPLLRDVDAMLRDLARQILPRTSEPYAIYGHSMGALLAYLLTIALQQRQCPLPQHLFVSGRQSPGIPRRMPPLHALPDEEFLRQIQAFGGLPEVIARERELVALFLPVLRADFQALESYAVPDAIRASRIPVPITVFFGASDYFPRRDAEDWQNFSTGKVAVHEFSGDHFFIFHHLSAIGGIISRTLALQPAGKPQLST